MQKLMKPKGSIMALLLFLPVTPTIAAVTVFTHSVLKANNTEVSLISNHTEQVFDAYEF